ncbi:hypothetical protein ABLE68_06125 [Nocardioides sp. CN2-186]|uniref:hypothetical protein n=1 Tax=Nocardioides tweenelious TaxID=3156607 RepID=UPI0032B5A8B6
MVRRDRREARRHPSRWTGPPPLLLLATVLGFLVAPLVDHDAPDEPAPQAAIVSVAATPRSIEPRIVRPQVVPSSQGGQLTAGLKPLRLAPLDVGVASMNMFRQLSSAHALHDARRLTSRPGVDVVGWQEAEDFGAVLHRLPGFATKTFPYSGGSSELAISWRSSRFRLVAADQKRVAYGVSSYEGRYPFGNRLVAQVTLQDRQSGRQLTVINVHLPQKIEDFDHHPGHWTDTKNAFRARIQLQRLAAIWAQAQGRWVIGTGDFNFDARADAAYLPAGGPTRALRRTAVSSYEELGLDVATTFPENGRNIDYVWADKGAYRSGRIQFDGQWVLSGYNSDHRPLLTRLVLR